MARFLVTLSSILTTTIITNIIYLLAIGYMITELRGSGYWKYLAVIIGGSILAFSIGSYLNNKKTRGIELFAISITRNVAFLFLSFTINQALSLYMTYNIEILSNVFVHSDKYIDVEYILFSILIISNVFLFSVIFIPVDETSAESSGTAEGHSPRRG